MNTIISLQLDWVTVAGVILVSLVTLCVNLFATTVKKDEAVSGIILAAVFSLIFVVMNLEAPNGSKPESSGASLIIQISAGAITVLALRGYHWIQCRKPTKSITTRHGGIND